MQDYPQQYMEGHETYQLLDNYAPQSWARSYDEVSTPIYPSYFSMAPPQVMAYPAKQLQHHHMELPSQTQHHHHQQQQQQHQPPPHIQSHINHHHQIQQHENKTESSSNMLSSTPPLPSSTLAPHQPISISTPTNSMCHGSNPSSTGAGGVGGCFAYESNNSYLQTPVIPPTTPFWSGGATSDPASAAAAAAAWGQLLPNQFQPPSSLFDAANPPPNMFGMPPVKRVFSFVSMTHTKTKKRHRRRYEEIDRVYQCRHPSCNKSYGTLNNLNAHILMQNHGPKRSAFEFKELVRRQQSNMKL